MCTWSLYTHVNFILMLIFRESLKKIFSKFAAIVFFFFYHIKGTRALNVYMYAKREVFKLRFVRSLLQTF